ncbi:hypothetical protein SAMN06295970_12179 [Noviherbaspirillum suwonense]|uniref:Uncharacterized protein n=1 Tax=Noviherbaspirillum suwonense TaxID=1224511 RepID=A0ABY1QLK2_9BURK|nr:hypothetical protein SAMN06295970_12179 [Noviherbaspirillum suwonense]
MLINLAMFEYQLSENDVSQVRKNSVFPCHSMNWRNLAGTHGARTDGEMRSLPTPLPMLREQSLPCG